MNKIENKTENKTKKSLLEFPCQFPIKIFGKKSSNFEELVLAIFNKYIIVERDDVYISKRTSNNGKYLAITITFQAHSQFQLDCLYQDLHSVPEVLMTL